MKAALIIISILAMIGILSTVEYACNQSKTHVTDGAFDNYEEFQSIYNTCNQLNSDLCNIKSIDENDKMFEQFSKNQRMTGLRQKLNRWVEEYNAKSKMWNRSMWKSNTLPYQLSASDFSCY